MKSAEYTLSLIVFAAVFASAALATASSYRQPQDPIAPRSMAQCEALREQYRAIAVDLWAQSETLHRRASVKQPYDHEMAGEANDLKGTSLQLKHEGNMAYYRCERKVRAYNASLKDEGESATETIRTERNHRQSGSTNDENIVRKLSKNSRAARQAERDATNAWNKRKSALNWAKNALSSLDSVSTVPSAGVSALNRASGMTSSANAVENVFNFLSGKGHTRTQGDSAISVVGVLNSLRIGNPLSKQITGDGLNFLQSFQQGAMASLNIQLRQLKAQRQAKQARIKKLQAIRKVQVQAVQNMAAIKRNLERERQRARARQEQLRQEAKERRHRVAEERRREEERLERKRRAEALERQRERERLRAERERRRKAKLAEQRRQDAEQRRFERRRQLRIDKQRRRDRLARERERERQRQEIYETIQNLQRQFNGSNGNGRQHRGGSGLRPCPSTGTCGVQ